MKTNFTGDVENIEKDKDEPYKDSLPSNRESQHLRLLELEKKGVRLASLQILENIFRLSSFNRFWRFVDSFNLSHNLCIPRLKVASSRLRSFATSRIVADFQSKTDKSVESRSHRKKYVGPHCLDVSHDKAYQGRTNAFSETFWQIEKG